MAKKIYVGNLTWGTTNEDLLGLFQTHGAVAHAQVLTDHETGQSRGFGFVAMANDGEGQAAIDALNGASFHGRPLKVNEAAAPERRGPGDGTRGVE